MTDRQRQTEIDRQGQRKKNNNGEKLSVLMIATLLKLFGDALNILFNPWHQTVYCRQCLVVEDDSANTDCFFGPA